MKKGKYIICFAFIGILLFGAASGYSQTKLTIEGGYMLQTANSTISLNNAQLINNGTFRSEAGTVRVRGDGSDEQSAIGGDSVSVFHNLQIEKSANGAQLQQNIQVNAELFFVNGHLDLHGDTITLGDNGSVEGEGPGRMLIGPNGGVIQMRLDLNAPQNDCPGNLGFCISSDQNLGSTLVQRSHVPQSFNGANGIERCYRVLPSNNSDLMASISLGYLESELNGNTEADLGPWRQDSSFWYNPSFATPNAGLNYVTVDSINFLSEWTLADAAPKVDVKAFLQGAYSTATQQMEDDLRSLNLLPRAEPYAGLGFGHVSSGGGETVQVDVLNKATDAAIVDWIFVELRDAVDSSQVIATRSGLITKAGHVVELDGQSPLSFPGIAVGTNCYIALRHRNHLGAMTANPILITADGNSSYDFTDRTLAAFEQAANPQAAQYDNGTHTLLWAGDADGNNEVVYVGGTDITPISAAVFLNPLNPSFDPSMPVSDVYDRA
ncbi:MAG: hypothetical protein AAFV25_23385, partial [Bacteroidota bacterium]